MRGQEGEASVLSIVHGDGQPLAIGIMVSVRWRKDFRGDALAQPKIGMNMPIPCLGFFHLSGLAGSLLSPPQF